MRGNAELVQKSPEYVLLHRNLKYKRPLNKLRAHALLMTRFFENRPVGVEPDSICLLHLGTNERGLPPPYCSL